MNVLTLLIVGIDRIDYRNNGNIVLELNPETMSTILYHVLAFGCVILLAMDGRLVNELIKTIGIAYVVKRHGSGDSE